MTIQNLETPLVSNEKTNHSPPPIAQEGINFHCPACPAAQKGDQSVGLKEKRTPPVLRKMSCYVGVAGLLVRQWQTRDHKGGVTKKRNKI